MDNITSARWTAIGLHTIVLIYALAIGLPTIGLDPAETVRQAKADPSLEQALRLFLIVVSGNLIGAVLLLTKLFNSRTGLYWLLGYELLFLVASFVFLAIEYGVVVGIIVVALLYALIMRKRATEIRAS